MWWVADQRTSLVRMAAGSPNQSVSCFRRLHIAGEVNSLSLRLGLIGWDAHRFLSLSSLS